jgi:hypothetical protein
MSQGFQQSRLQAALRKFYGRYKDLICSYNFSLGHMLSDMFHTNLDYGSYHLANLEIGITLGVTSQQGMLIPPWPLVPSLVFPGVHVTCGLFHYLNWTLILTVDFSVNLIRRTDFNSGLFRLPNSNTLIMTTDFYV